MYLSIRLNLELVHKAPAAGTYAAVVADSPSHSIFELRVNGLTTYGRFMLGVPVSWYSTKPLPGLLLVNRQVVVLHRQTQHGQRRRVHFPGVLLFTVFCLPRAIFALL